MACFGYWGAVALAIGAGAVSAGCGGSSFATGGTGTTQSCVAKLLRTSTASTGCN